MPPDMNTKVTLGGGFELAVLTRVSDPFVFGLDVSLEIVPGLGLVRALSAVISHPLVLGSLMLGQMTGRGSLELALITRILDSVMVSADMDLQVVS